jgi:hypothetical protein
LEVNFDLIPSKGKENIDETGRLAGERRERGERKEERGKRKEERRGQSQLIEACR